MHILHVQVRELMSDFAVIIALTTMVFVDYYVGLETPKLFVPTNFEVKITLGCLALRSKVDQKNSTLCAIVVPRKFGALLQYRVKNGALCQSRTKNLSLCVKVALQTF